MRLCYYDKRMEIVNHMPPKKNISIKDIARMAGVSTATVSHVMNETGRYSTETAQKVHAVIDRYGYVSNNAAKSLRGSSTRTIGLIVPNIRNEFFADVAASIENYFYEHSYSVFICNSSNETEKEINYFHQLNFQRVDGIVCISGQRMIDNDIVNRDIPIVLLDRSPINSMNLPVIQSDDRDGFTKAMNILLKKGCRKIIYVGSRTSQYQSGERKNAYMDALSSHGIAIDPDMILDLHNGSPSNEQSEVLITDYLKSGRTMDGIICASDNSALGTLAALKRAGIRVPEDVKVFGFDNSFSSSISNPSLSTIGRNPDLMALKASEKLYHMITGTADDIPNHLVLPIDVIERDSTRS